MEKTEIAVIVCEDGTVQILSKGDMSNIDVRVLDLYLSKYASREEIKEHNEIDREVTRMFDDPAWESCF